jgi:hypothetical protein
MQTNNHISHFVMSEPMSWNHKHEVKLHMHCGDMEWYDGAKQMNNEDGCLLGCCTM